ARRDELATLLDHLEGTVEARIRAFYLEDAVLRRVLIEAPAILRLRDHLRGRPGGGTYQERIQLGELVAAALADRRARDACRIGDALAPHAVDRRPGELTTERMVTN